MRNPIIGNASITGSPKAVIQLDLAAKTPKTVPFTSSEQFVSKVYMNSALKKSHIVNGI